MSVFGEGMNTFDPLGVWTGFCIGRMFNRAGNESILD